MKRGIGVALILGTLSAWLAGAAPAQAAACAPAGYSVVTKTSTAAVVRHRRTGAMFGCYRETGRRTRLQISMASDEIGELELNGRFVAYELTYTDEESANWTSVFSLDTRAGKRWGRAVSCGGSEYGPMCALSRIVVKRNGSAAWIRNDVETEPARAIVEKCPIKTCFMRPRAPRVLDPGPGVSERVLRLRANTVAWVRDGVTRRAPLD